MITIIEIQAFLSRNLGANKMINKTIKYAQNTHAVSRQLGSYIGKAFVRVQFSAVSVIMKLVKLLHFSLFYFFL